MIPFSPKFPCLFGCGPAPSGSTSVSRMVTGPAGHVAAGWMSNSQPSLPAVVRAVVVCVVSSCPFLSKKVTFTIAGVVGATSFPSMLTLR